MLFANLSCAFVWSVRYLVVWNWFVFVCSNYFISGFFLFWQATKYLFKNTILKSYIKVSNKPLCILSLFLYQKFILLQYFKSGILISHICFIKTLLYSNRVIILFFKTLKYCGHEFEWSLNLQNITKYFENFLFCILKVIAVFTNRKRK